MKALHLKKTELTPSVIFNPKTSGLKIEGKMIPENVDSIFVPITEWIKNYLKQNQSLHLLFRLYYYNTSSARQFFLLFKKMNEYTTSEKNVSVRWEYEEGDEEGKTDAEEFLAGANFSYEIVSVKI